ncbi:MAG: hypothetical protein KBD79_07735 [Chitinophagales bacterium]|nr:hypothetical protein [Chitinophagales bacterium]
MKYLLIFMMLFAGIANAQIVMEEANEKETPPAYEVKEDSFTIEKTITKEDVVVTNLDELFALVDKYNADIASNQAQIIYFEELIAKLNEEIVYLKELGAKTEEEVKGGK